MHFYSFTSYFSCAITITIILTMIGAFLKSSTVVAIRAPSAIFVNKCCRMGDHLDVNQQCEFGGTDQWWPIIFLILKLTYFEPHGEAPRFMKIRESSFPQCEHPEFEFGNDKMALFSNGTLYLFQKNVFLDSNNFCIDKDAAAFCLPIVNGANSLTAPKKLSKLRKCCGLQAAYFKSANTCVPVQQNHDVLRRKLISNSSVVDMVYGFPDCKISKHFTIAGHFKESNLELSTGSLTLDSGRQFEWDEYCLEHTVKDTESSYVSVFTCAEDFTVADTVTENKIDIRFYLFPIGLLISVVFLIATLATGFLLPSSHHMLHWRCQTFYVACLLVGDLLLAITQLFGSKIKGVTCISIAIGMHFFFLAAFFWLNTMCVNIWWTFRDFRPTSLERGQEIVRLRFYKVYAWGGPLIITGTAAMLDRIRTSSLSKETFLRPQFCEKEYWFSGNLEKLVFFYGPVGILLCVNLLLFASTARQLTCGLWKREEVKSTTERAALGRVCMKLVIVMGVTWVADVLSWAHGVWFGGPYFIWLITDLINALQGVFIFIVVGCQPQITAAVKRLWSSKSGQSSTNTTHGQHHSSSSQGVPSIGESMTNNTFTNTTNTKIPMETIC